MTEQQVLVEIDKIVSNILSGKGLDPVSVKAGTELLGEGLGIDSLDLAMLVRELEETVGFDPFANGFIDFRTAGELAKLYVR
jgi:acyl carrier protein